ncbi:unnamed protein product [Spirodela intermedia]|uniref:VQ domain-containing protein n=1 Tax=Spirodela intermedia TaxID=51605 RepID=A0A7I8LFD3_SPIIN|nr:unnamed protein product [Spirodela intermedia]
MVQSISDTTGGSSMKQHGGDEKTPAPAMIAVRAESHVISKMRPKIRIVHIVAPEIIQTDAENFRDLVQKLTGKHAERGGGRKKAARAASPENGSPVEGSLNEYLSPELGKRVKLEAAEAAELEMRVENSGALFADLDAFMQELCEMPSIPLGSFHGDPFSEEAVCV